MHFAADNQDALALTRLDQAIGEIQRVEESTALGSQVDIGDFSGAELVVKKERCSGEFVLGREGGQEDEVDVTDIQLGGLQRLFACRPGQISRGFSIDNPASLFDAGPLLDPFVGGVHPLGQIIVGDDLVRDAHSGSNDLRAQVSIHFLGSPDAGRFDRHLFQDCCIQP